MFTISYVYSVQNALGRWRTHDGLVGRYKGEPVGYGPAGPSAAFDLKELPRVIEILTQQLGTVPTVTLRPMSD